MSTAKCPQSNVLRQRLTKKTIEIVTVANEKILLKMMHKLMDSKG